MKRLALLVAVAALAGAAAIAADSEKPAAEKGWISLFDGKSLDGWKCGENANAFKVEDGMIVVNGNVGHLFYEGKVKDHVFKNFEFKADVMTFPKANSGIYFHTVYQEKGWPSKGFEAQVNNSHSDWKRTGGLYNVADVQGAARQGQRVVQLLYQGRRQTCHPEDQRQGHDRLDAAGRLERPGRQPRPRPFERHIRPPGPRSGQQGVLQEHRGETAGRLSGFAVAPRAAGC